MNKYDYLGMRGKLYEAVSTLGNLAESEENDMLNYAYQEASEMLDFVDEYGVRNGILDEFTLELKDDCTKGE